MLTKQPVLKFLFKYKKLILLAIILGIGLNLYEYLFTRKKLTWWSIRCPTNFNDSTQLECIKQHGFKSIQLLTNYFKTGDKWGDVGLGTNPFFSCPEYRCFAFRYRNDTQIALENSDAVLVHVPDFFYLPSRNTYNRSRRQLWSFFTMESQRRTYCLKMNELDDWFNLTMTVKNDFSYHFYDLKQLDQYYEYYKAYHSVTKPQQRKQTRKQAVWFVSNCNTYSKREKFARELSEFIEIDIFGACNHFNNSKPDPCVKSTDPDKCMIKLLSNYKFHLSLENSHCESYITEKYYKIYNPEVIFESDLIPIVRGARKEDYLKQAPSNNSFIYADDFLNVISLAEYLIYLDRNETAYWEFFAWKNELTEKLELLTYTFMKTWLSPVYVWPMCELCEKLHDESFMSKQDNGVVKLSEVFNPVRDCERDFPGQTEEQFYAELENYEMCVHTKRLVRDPALENQPKQMDENKFPTVQRKIEF